MAVTGSSFLIGKETWAGGKDLAVYFHVVSQTRIRGAILPFGPLISNISFGLLYLLQRKNHGSSVDAATGYRQNGPGAESWQRRNWSLLHNNQTGFVAHLVSHPTGTDSNFPGGKAAGK
jgi:hypothetical protein